MPLLEIALDNPAMSCRLNEKLILDILRSIQNASKAQLARLTGLTAVAVGGLMKSLEEKGLVESIGKLQGDMGQPATLYSIASDGAYGLGISVNRGHFETVLVNFNGEVISSVKHEAILPSPEQVLPIVLADINSLLADKQTKVKKRVVGLGLALPSNITSRDRDVDRWQAWSESSFSEQLGSALGAPVIMQNDVNAAALAEFTHGGTLSSDSFLYVYFGGALATSLGSALVFNGACWNGVSGNAGDIGLAPILSLPAEIRPGSNTSRLSDMCSLHSLVVLFRHHKIEIDSHAGLIEAIEQYPNLFDSWLDEFVEHASRFLFGLQAILDLPEFIFDCEEAVEPIVGPVFEKLSSVLGNAPDFGLHPPKLSRGSFGGHASAIGAANLPLEASFNPKL